MANAKEEKAIQDEDLHQDNDEGIDEVADKAEKIGEDLGVTKAGDGKEALPDYEVVEDDGDERIVKDRTPAPKTERKQFSNKEKRDYRKKKMQEKFNAKDEVIAQLQQEAQELRQWKSQIEGRLTSADKAKVEDAITQTRNALAQAEADHAAAFTEGDGVKLTKAMKIMYDAARQLDQLNGIKQQYERLPTNGNAASNAPAVDSAVVNKAKAWAAKNREWYNPDGKDEDSEIAKSISGVLASEGFDPKTDDFWDELDDRLASRGIGNDEVDEEEDEAPRKPAVRKRASPPVNGGSSRADVSGKKRVNLPTAFVNTLKENGMWDDKEKRNRLIQRYLAGVKEETRH